MVERGGIVGRRRKREVEEREQRSGDVAEEWVRLVGPVEAAWAPGVAGG